MCNYHIQCSYNNFITTDNWNACKIELLLHFCNSRRSKYFMLQNEDSGTVLMYWQFLIHFSVPPPVQGAPIAGGLVAAIVVAAIVVILLCIGVTIIVCLKRRKQHTRKANLTRYVASPCELILKLLCRSNINPFLSFL